MGNVKLHLASGVGRYHIDTLFGALVFARNILIDFRIVVCDKVTRNNCTIMRITTAVVVAVIALLY